MKPLYHKTTSLSNANLQLILLALPVKQAHQITHPQILIHLIQPKTNLKK